MFHIIRNSWRLCTGGSTGVSHRYFDSQPTLLLVACLWVGPQMFLHCFTLLYWLLLEGIINRSWLESASVNHRQPWQRKINLSEIKWVQSETSGSYFFSRLLSSEVFTVWEIGAQIFCKLTILTLNFVCLYACLLQIHFWLIYLRLTSICICLYVCLSHLQSWYLARPLRPAVA